MTSSAPQQLNLQIAEEGLAGNEPASPDHHPKKHAEACFHASTTPLSQASTAPTTPNMFFRMPSLSLDGFDEEHFPLLTRQLSIPEEEGATFEAPSKLQDVLQDVRNMYEQKYGGGMEDDQQDFTYSDEGSDWTRDSGAPKARPRSSQESLETLLGEVKDLYEKKYGLPVDEQDAPVEQDGLLWNVTRGTGVPKDCRIAKLEQKLAEVKQLYELKYGEEVDSEEDLNVQLDADGTPWIETRGTGVARDMRLERLEAMLGNVKELYTVKYGRDVDTEYDADGTPWTLTQGTGVPRDCRVERLEQKLAEVKQLYELKYGEEVDSAEDLNVQIDADGTPWIETRGTGVARDMRLERLEAMLGNVKELYTVKYGRDVDTEYDADGTPWKLIQGTVVPRDCRVERLEQKLAEVKELYKLKYGRSVSTESACFSSSGDYLYDDDGTLWIKSVTTGTRPALPAPSQEALELMLQEAKSLCQQRFGSKTVEEAQSSWSDEDGTPWVQVGSSSQGGSVEEEQSFTGTCSLQ